MGVLFFVFVGPFLLRAVLLDYAGIVYPLDAATKLQLIMFPLAFAYLGLVFWFKKFVWFIDHQFSLKRILVIIFVVSVVLAICAPLIWEIQSLETK
ncbi:MAG: hypothetical protein AB8B55_22225 [Mariniblastus sp.]